MRRPRDRAPASLFAKGTMMVREKLHLYMVDLQNFRTVRKLLNILLFSCCAPARLPTAMPQLPTDNTFELFVSFNQLELLPATRYCPPPNSLPPSSAFTFKRSFCSSFNCFFQFLKISFLVFFVKRGHFIYNFNTTILDDF